MSNPISNITRLPTRPDNAVKTETALLEMILQNILVPFALAQLFRANVLSSPSSTAQWYYKDNDEEFTAFGSTDSRELEELFEHFPLLGTVGRILRVDSNAQLKRNLLRIPRRRSFQNIGAALDEKNNLQPSRLYCELQRGILFEAHCGGDAVSVHIDSVLSDICYDTICLCGQTNDLPMASIQIEKMDENMNSEAYFESVDAWLCAIGRRSCLDMVPLYQQCSIRVSSSMLSYLLQPNRDNQISVVVYDSDFRLLAVGVYRAEYVALFEGIDSNPYGFESLLNFHHTLGELYAESQYNEGIRVKYMVSTFNRSVRVCLGCDTEAMLWSPAIATRQTLKDLMRRLPSIQCIGDTFDNASSLAKLPESVSALVGLARTDAVIAEQEQRDEIYTIECVVCCETVEKGNAPMFHNHKDLCAECVAEWRKHSDGCPKCGAIIAV